MNNQIAQFIDRYSNSDVIPDDGEFEFIEDDIELTTPWEEFCNTADAWARQGARTNPGTMRFLQNMAN